MISFGLISSLFDFLTFGFLLLVMHASVDTFRTAWFVESLLTQLAIVLIVRTHHGVLAEPAKPVALRADARCGVARHRNPLPSGCRLVRVRPTAASRPGRRLSDHDALSDRIGGNETLVLRAGAPQAGSSAETASSLIGRDRRSKNKKGGMFPPFLLLSDVGKLILSLRLSPSRLACLQHAGTSHRRRESGRA